jgi:hypothetical protein
MTMGRKKQAEMSAEVSRVLLGDLFEGSVVRNGERQLLTATRKQAAIKFKMSERNIQRLWAKAKKRRQEEGVYTCSPRKKGIVGKERVSDRPGIIKELEAMPREERTAIRSMAGRLESAPSTLHGMIRN